MKALIVDEPWIGLILRGEKIWEMRKTGCSHRGPIALIRKGSGTVVGVAEVANSLPEIGSLDAYARAEPQHRIPPERQAQAFRDGWRTPWVLANVRVLPKPVPYRHPNGAVIWVNLDEDVAAKVESQLGAGSPLPREPRLGASYNSPPVPGTPTESSRTAGATATPAGTVREVVVTGGNLRNSHLYLPLAFFPDDVIGGPNRASAASRGLTAVFRPGATIRTDIDRTKRILRDRAAIRDFFVRSGIEEGDTVRITRVASHTYHFEKA